MTKKSTQDAGTKITSGRTRRELLAGAAAGTAGVIGALALTRPTTAHAANGGAVILAAQNTATGATAITATGVTGQDDATAFIGKGANGGQGAYCESPLGIALWGYGSAGGGVYGQSDTGVGVLGHSGYLFPNPVIDPHGVRGVNSGPSGYGVFGQNIGSPGGDGVHGSTGSNGNSGVYGENSGTGYGIAGRCDSGTGASGYSANGVGVVATSPKGTALSVTGKAKFNRSGVASIAAPAVSATVTVPGGLSTSALVLAVMQNAVAGVWVVSAVPNTSTGKATITLNKAPAGTAKVAWFVVN
jgi:hypothetical protein